MIPKAVAFNWSVLFLSHKKLGFTKSLSGKSLGGGEGGEVGERADCGGMGAFSERAGTEGGYCESLPFSFSHGDWGWIRASGLLLTCPP